MADEVSSFWGPVTSTHEWCEPNYVHTSYVAEFFNTISNVPCIILAFIGLGNALRQCFEKRFSVLHISNIILAIGSMLYHASLQQLHVIVMCRRQFLSLTSLATIRTEANTAIILRKRTVINDPLEFFFRQQQGDETPMVWEMLLYIYILYSPDWHYRSTMPTFLVLYGAAFGITHSLLHFDVAFKLHYALLCLLCIPRMYKYYIHTEDISAKWLAKLYVATLLFGSLCWLVDRLFCKEITRWYFNPQGHALWHVFMGFNSYFANTFLMYCRAQQREWNPKVKHIFGLLPYVKIHKSKSQ